MSYTNLVGSHESFADTIRKWFSDLWIVSDFGTKPKFISPGGVDSGTEPLTENDMRLLEKDLNYFVKFTPGDSEILESSNYMIYGSTEVRIDVFAESESEIIASKLDTILQKNYDAQINKTDGSRSAIDKIEEYAINWTIIDKQPESGIIEQHAGTITILWQKYI